MADQVDASIPLQAGRNLPTFGPDWQVIQSAQRNALAMQQAQQTVQAQNALSQFANTPGAFDPKTMTANPDAMANLLRASPSAFMQFSNQLAGLQEKQARGTALQSEVSQAKQAEAQELRGAWLQSYQGYLEKFGDQKAAYDRATEEVWRPGIARLKSGLPPAMAQIIPESPDPIQVRNNFNAYQAAKLAPKIAEKTAEIGVDVAKQNALMPGAVAQASAIKSADADIDIAKKAKEQQVAPEYAVPMKTGSGTQEVPVVSDGKGGWKMAAAPFSPVPDISGLHKISGKETPQATGGLLSAKTPDGKDILVKTGPGGIGIVAQEDGRSLTPGVDYVPESVQQKKSGGATEEQARATAEAIYEMRQPPLTGFAMRSGTGPQIMGSLRS